MDDTAPLSEMSCLRKNDMAFFDMGLVRSFGDENSLDGVKEAVLVALRRYLMARTGHRTRSGRSPTNSVKDGTMKDRGRGLEAVSVLAMKNGS